MSSDNHPDAKTHAIVPRPGTDLAESSRRTHPVIARMTRDVLARAESHGLGMARYRIGEYLLREPDYRQVLHWAAALSMPPESVLAQLAASRLDPYPWQNLDPITFVLEDGAIRSMVWDFGRLPLAPEHWEDSLLIQSFGLKGTWPEHQGTLRLYLPHLRILYCNGSDISLLDISGTPRLTALDCSCNQLTALAACRT